MESSIFQFGLADYLKQWSIESLTTMPRSDPLLESNKRMLRDVKDFAEVVKLFSEKIEGPSGEQRRDPMVLFVKNYLRHYSTALIDQVIDLEFRNSFSLFERTIGNLMGAYCKLSESYTSIFQEEQIAGYAKKALQELQNEGRSF